MLSALSGVRGYAVLLVLFAHSSNLGYHLFGEFDFSGAGKNGVFIFFTLSAFLLARQFFNYFSRKDEKIKIASFVKIYFLKRFIRIYPFFFLSIVTYLIISKFITPVYINDIATAVTTLFLLEGPGIFWTIAVEFKFYLFLPLIAYILHIAKMKSVHLLVAYLLTVFFLSFFADSSSSVSLLNFLTFFITGVYGAYLYVEFSDKYISLNISLKFNFLLNFINITCLLILTLFVPAFFNDYLGVFISKKWLHSQQFVFSLCSIALIITSIHPACITSRIFKSRSLRLLGDISFIVYLGHMLIIYSFIFFNIPKNSIYTLAMYFLIILISYVVYRWIEKPFVEYGYKKLKK